MRCLKSYMFLTTINGELSAVITLKELNTKSFVEIVSEIMALHNSPASVVSAIPATPKSICLQFFTSFNTPARQEALRQAIGSITSRMDVKTGRDWVAVYLAYCFFAGQLKLTKRYADFFYDIDLLMPDLLGNVDASKSGYGRYKSLAESLAAECKNWFVCNGCLPPQTEWTSSLYHYHVADSKRMLVHELVASLTKAFITA